MAFNSLHSLQKPDTQTQRSKPRNPKPGTQNPKPETQNPKPKTQTQNPKPNTYSPQPTSQSPSPNTQRPKKKNVALSQARVTNSGYLGAYFSLEMRRGSGGQRRGRREGLVRTGSWKGPPPEDKDPYASFAEYSRATARPQRAASWRSATETEIATQTETLSDSD